MMTKVEISIHEVEFIVVDVETTGFSASYDHIIEIGAIRFNTEKVLSRFSTFVKPPVPIPIELSEHVHGITDAMVENAPTIEDVLTQFSSYIVNSVLVGHNIGFDLRFINAALTRMGHPVIENIPLIDTCALAKKSFPNFTEFKLESLVKKLGVYNATFHRAMADASNTQLLLFKCIEQLSIMGDLPLKELLVL